MGRPNVPGAADAFAAPLLVSHTPAERSAGAGANGGSDDRRAVRHRQPLGRYRSVVERRCGSRASSRPVRPGNTALGRMLRLALADGITDRRAAGAEAADLPRRLRV